MDLEILNDESRNETDRIWATQRCTKYSLNNTLALNQEDENHF